MATQSLLGLTETMGLPKQIRFGASQAYAPMGYFGVVALDY
jgi:hypothetical protein